MKKLVFTGGHHTSALEVARGLQAKGWEIVWFGHRHTMWGDTSDSAEYRDVTSAGIKFYDLQAGKFYHTYNPVKLLRIPWGFVQALVWLVKERPAGIVSFGGYLAVPTVVAGWLLGIKSLTHEQTVVAGWANKLIGRLASKIALTWPESQKYYPKAKTVVTGLPIPEELKSRGAGEYKSKKPLLLIVGGKQGSHTINEVVFKVLPELVKNYEVWHQTGESSLHNDLQTAQGFSFANYHPFGYSRQEYLDKLVSADVVISRAGAHTVYELGVLGKPCVLIPIPWVSHQEQLKNAQVLVDHKQAILLTEDKLTPESLLTTLNQAQNLRPEAFQLPTDGTEQLVRLIEQTYA